MKAVIAPAGISAGASSTRPSASHDGQQYSAEQERTWHHEPVVAAEPLPKQMRYDEADEADRTRKRHRRRRQESNRRCIPRLDAASLARPACRGPCLAHGEQVPLAPLTHDDDARCHDHSTYTSSVGRSIASRPPISQREIAKDCDMPVSPWTQQNECRADAVDRDTGEQKARRREVAASGRGSHHDEQNQRRLRRARRAQLPRRRRPCASPNAMAITAPSDAPVETPSVYGVASASRSID